MTGVDMPKIVAVDTDFEDNYFVATTNVHSPFLKWFVRVKNGAKKDTVYVNTGVLLMNIEKLRREQSHEEVLAYINRRKFFSHSARPGRYFHPLRKQDQARRRHGL